MILAKRSRLNLCKLPFFLFVSRAYIFKVSISLQKRLFYFTSHKLETMLQVQKPIIIHSFIRRFSVVENNIA